MSVKRTEVYLSRDLRVTSRTGFSRKAIIITFDSFTDIRNLDRKGFAEEFLIEKKIDAIHFISRENDWYQYSDLSHAAATASKISSVYERVIAYGSSMGGYAAIRFGRLLGATTAIACSPQYSIDPNAVPFEKRWQADAERIGQFPLERNPPCALTDEAVVFYDPHDLDQKHIDLYKSQTTIYSVLTPNSGHPCTSFLAEIGILQEMLQQIVTGEFNLRECQRVVRQKRRNSAQLYFNLSRRARKAEHQLLFAKSAVELSGQVPEYMSQYGKALASSGRHEEAEAAHLRALSLAPNHPVILYHLSDYYEQIGAIRRAFEVFSYLLQLQPNVSLYRPRHEYLAARVAESNSLSATGCRQTNSNSVDQSMTQSSTPPGYRGLVQRLLLRAAEKLGPEKKRTVPSIGNQVQISPFEILPLEILVTVFPSPPPLLSSWRRHRVLLDNLPPRDFDVLLVGDSLVEYWPEDPWKGATIFNLGIAADKTQHLLWRLNEISPGRIMSRYAVLLIGTNNLGAGDEPEGILAGISAIVARLRVIAPKTQVLVIEIPPCGPEFGFRKGARLRTNDLIRRAKEFASVNIDKEITSDFSGLCDNYHEDKIHFSIKGYELLSKILVSRFTSDIFIDSRS